MIKYTEKIEKTIKSELHEGTKWVHKSKQTKKMYWKNTWQKIAVVTIRTFTCDSFSYQFAREVIT